MTYPDDYVGKIICGDSLEIMELIPDKSIDMILCDLPYEETGNKWDSGFDFKKLFVEYERIIKEDGAIVLTGTFRFGVLLFNTAPHLYKYDWVWEKDNGTNAPNTPYQPFRIHENVYVFGKGRVTNGTRIPMKYNPQKTKGEPYKQMSGKMSENWKGGLKNIVTNNESGDRHPQTIQKFNRDRGLHPTQKPVALGQYLVRTYTNEGDLILDNTCGSGSFLVAALLEKRKFIGIELDENYCAIARKRLEDTQKDIDSKLSF